MGSFFITLSFGSMPYYIERHYRNTTLLLHNSFRRASSSASATINTTIRIYYIDVAFAYCAYRTFILAGTASDTFVCDKMSHNLILSNS